MGLGEQALFALALLAVLLFFGPGVYSTVRHSRKGSASEWLLVARIGVVIVLFVLTLILLVR